MGRGEKTQTVMETEQRSVRTNQMTPQLTLHLHLSCAMKTSKDQSVTSQMSLHLNRQRTM